MHKNPKLLALTSYTRWMLATIPANLAYAPLATLVPLYVLALGGNLVDVALTATAFNAVSTLFSFFWGRLTDMAGKRKQFILISYIGVTALLFLMYFSSNVLELILLYSGIGLFQQANPTAYNLLVMETDRRENWSKNFSSLQTVSGIGMVIGLIIAAIVAGFSSLKVIILLFGISSLVSTVFAYFVIIEPNISVKKEEEVGKHLVNIFSLLSYPLRFVRLPEPKKVLGIVRNLHLSKRMHSTFALLCISWLIFNIGMSMVNAEYPASLNVHGVAESGVFMVILLAMIIQTALFYYVHRMLNKDRLEYTMASMIAVRGISYVMIGMSFLIIGVWFFAANIFLYALFAGFSYPIYYTSSYSILFKSIGDRGRGNALGIYNGIGWVGYLSGAIFAGVILVEGFTLFYITAALLIFASIYPLKAILNPNKHTIPERPQHASVMAHSAHTL